MHVDAVPLQVDTRKAVALLGFLAVDGPRQTRERLTGLLWPDSTTERARGSLRRTLSVLSSALGGRWVHADRIYVTLDGSEVSCDVAELRAGLARAAEHDHLDLASCGPCRGALAAGVVLYRGEFMAGFRLRDADPFEDWQLLEAEVLAREVGEALADLTRAEEEAGELVSALGHARRWLQVDPLAERAHQAVMRTAARLGRRDEALRQYLACAAVLDRELGVPPLPDTTALHEAILAGEVVADRPPPTLAADPSPAARAPGAFFGRQDDLAWLHERHGCAGSGTQVAAVEGEAGIGKTRLLDELARGVEERGGSVLSARCHEGESGLALGPVVELVRAAAETGRLDTVPRGVRAELARLVPALGDADLPPAAPIDSPGAQVRLFAAVGEALHAATSGALPGVVTIDDAHWADATTLDLVAYLARRPAGRRLLLVLTWRPEEVGADHTLRRLIPNPRCLARLDRRTVAAAVAAARPEAAGLADRLYEETGGVPFFVTQYLAALPASANAPWELPGAVRDLLRARLARTSSLARQVLTAAAVLDRSAELALLVRVSGRAEDEVVEAVEELLARSLVREESAEDGPRYAFTNPGIREVVLADASLARRRVLHRRSAEALTGPGSHDRFRAPRAARHFAAAGMDRAAAEQHMTAAARARSLFANAEALEHLEAALALGHPSVGEIQRQLGELHTLGGRYQAALACFAVARTYTEDPVEVADLERRTGAVHLRAGRWELAAAHLEAAVDRIPAADRPGDAARVLADLALSVARRGDTAAGRRHAAAACELADRSGDAAARAQVRNLLGMLDRADGDEEGARDHLTEAAAQAEQLSDPTAKIAAWNNLALVELSAGRPEQAVGLLTDALAEIEVLGDVHREAAVNNNLADALHALGREEEALEHLRAAVTRFAEVGADEPQHAAIWRLVDW